MDPGCGVEEHTGSSMQLDEPFLSVSKIDVWHHGVACQGVTCHDVACHVVAYHSVACHSVACSFTIHNPDTSLATGSQSPLSLVQETLNCTCARAPSATSLTP